MLRRFNRYIFLKSLSGVAIAFVGVSTSVLMVDLVEQSRAISGAQNANFLTALKFTLMRLPGLTEQSIPITVMIGTLLAFTSLSRKSEIIAMRAAGISAWRFFAPLCWLAVTIGLFVSIIIGPASAKLNDSYENQKASLNSIIKVEGNSAKENTTWINLPAQGGQIIISGASKGPITTTQFTLINATTYLYGKDGLTLLKSVDSQKAVREGNKLSLYGNIVSTSGESPKKIADIVLPLTSSSSIEGARDPRTLPLWELPQEAKTAQINGGSPQKYWLRFYKQIFLPVTIVAMALFAGIMSVGLDRSGGKVKSIFIAIIVGIGIYFFNEISGLLASSGRIPAVIAGVCPPVLSLSLTLAFLSYREDGVV